MEVMHLRPRFALPRLVESIVCGPCTMNYEPLNGPRITVVETTILCLIFCVVLLAIRMFRRFTFPGLRLNWLIANNLWAVVIVITAAMIGRALLLPVLGVPEPRINDEFAHLLTADTFSHFRLTNSTPAAWQNFETFHVNIRPTYHAMYPAAQGLTLALGQLIFHQPWIGVYLSTCLLYTSPSPRDGLLSRMPSSA